ALQQGKGAGYVDDESALIDSLGKMGKKAQDYRLLDQSISTTTVAIGVKKGEGKLLQPVNDALAEPESSGDAEKLFFKWYGPETKHQYQTRNFTIAVSK